MSATILDPTATKELQRLLDRLATTAAESLASLVAREVAVQLDETLLTDAGSLLPTLTQPHVAVRCAIAAESAERRLVLLFETRDACTLTGLLLMTPDEVIAGRRDAACLHEDDAQAFHELANILCAALAGVLKDAEVETGLRFQDLGSIQPPASESPGLPAGPLVACRLQLRIGDQPESAGWLLLDESTASAWNQAPLDPTTRDDDDAAASRADEDLADIPAAPVRGTLHAYLGTSDQLPMLRRSCRRVGLDLRRHNPAEVPNPAAHRGEIVVMDVPAGHYRQFEWCRRIKEFAAETRVVLLLHHPSRARVTHAFLARADVILGLPLAEGSLSVKLKGLLDR